MDVGFERGPFTATITRIDETRCYDLVLAMSDLYRE